MKKNISFIISLSLIFISIVSFNFISNIENVKAQNISSLSSIVTPGFSFKMDLRLGDTDPDVRELQKVLNADVDTMVNFEGRPGDGSPGEESTYFGNKTKLAVIKFQEKYRSAILTPVGLTAGNGEVNKLTRAKLNLLIGVINTSNSVGHPQSSANTVVASPIIAAPTPVVNSGPNMSVCQFINFLRNVNFVSAQAAGNAERTFLCQVVAAASPLPTVTLKVNNKTNSVRVAVNTNATISWTSTNATYCYTTQGNKDPAGSQSVKITTSGTFTVSCVGPGGTSSKSVSVVAYTPAADTTNNNTASGTASSTATTSNYVISTSTYVSNVINRVLKSDGGSNDVVAVPPSLSLRTDSKVTIEAWVKPASWPTKSKVTNNSDAVIISRGNLGDNIDYSLSLDNGKLVYGNNDAAIWTCSAVVPLNTWTHVAVTVDESVKDISLYVNGSKITNVCGGAHGMFNKSAINKQFAITNGTTTSAVYLGNYYSKYCHMQVSTNGFIGSLDDIRVWNIIRTPDQIIGTMASSVKGTTGLAAYWSFDNNNVSDITNNANYGTILGNIKIVADNTSSSTIASTTNIINSNSNSNSSYLSCMEKPIPESVPTEEVPVEEEPRVDVTFAGKVEYVGYCGGSDGNPNKYSSVVIKSLDGSTPVVASVTGSPTRSYGEGDAGSRLILRHSPHTGAPLPTVGSCVIGRSNGEIDTCSTTDTPYKSASGALIGTGAGGAPKTGNGYVAGGIIMELGFDNSKDCSVADDYSGDSGSGIGMQTGLTAAGALFGPVGAVIGWSVGTVFESFGW